MEEFNLDWVIKKIKELTGIVDTFTVVNKITWGGLHDPGKEYPRWCIVDTPTHEGYISIQPVPVGITIYNTEYWRQVANYSALYADFQNRIVALETKFNQLNYVTPEMYGAVGDGVTDDTASVQLALNHHNVKFKEGATYLVSSSLTVLGDSVLMGYATIKVADHSDITDGILDVNNKNNVSISNLIFNSNVDNQDGYAQGSGERNAPIKITTSSNVTVKECEFDGMYSGCVVAEYCTGNIVVSNNKFVGGTTSQGHGGFGVILRYNADDANIAITHNHFKCDAANFDYGYGAIFETSEKCNTEICDNVIVGFGRGGTSPEPIAPIELYIDTHNTKIANNKLINCYRFIRMSAAQNIVVKNNIFDEVSAKEPDSGLLLIYISTFYGTPNDCKNVIVDGNIFKTKSSSPSVIQLSSQSLDLAPHDVIITNNVIETSSSVIKVYGRCGNIIIKGNKSKGGVAFFHLLDTLGSNIVRNNGIIISDNDIECPGQLVYAMDNITPGYKPMLITGNRAICTSGGIIKVPAIFSDNEFCFYPGAYSPQPIVTYTQLVANENVYLFNNVCFDGFAQTSDAGAITNKNYFDGVEA